MSKKRLVVIKIGGNVIDDHQKLDAFINQFDAIEGEKILVHGGGKLATGLSNRLGVETQMIEGRRVTNKETIDIVTMVYGGLVNKTIVAKLQAKGSEALGLTGADGNAIRSVKRPLKNGVDYGFVGDVKEVNAKLFNTLLTGGFVPVVAPLTHDSEGQILNTNADTMATEIAIAMSGYFETTLVFTFELNGVMKDVNEPGSLLNEITPEVFANLKSEGAIHSGMIPKLDNAFYALDAGISKLYIGHFEKVGDIVSQNTKQVTMISKS